MTGVQKWLERAIRGLRKQAKVKRWKPGIPIRDIICWKDGGWGQVCQQVHGGYFCAACNAVWLLPETPKKTCACGAHVEVYADWDAFHRELQNRERHLHEMAWRERTL